MTNFQNNEILGKIFQQISQVKFFFKFTKNYFENLSLDFSFKYCLINRFLWTKNQRKTVIKLSTMTWIDGISNCLLQIFQGLALTTSCCYKLQRKTTGNLRWKIYELGIVLPYFNEFFWHQNIFGFFSFHRILESQCCIHQHTRHTAQALLVTGGGMEWNGIDLEQSKNNSNVSWFNDIHT